MIVSSFLVLENLGSDFLAAVFKVENKEKSKKRSEQQKRRKLEDAEAAAAAAAAAAAQPSEQVGLSDNARADFCVADKLVQWTQYRTSSDVSLVTLKPAPETTRQQILCYQYDIPLLEGTLLLGLTHCIECLSLKPWKTQQLVCASIMGISLSWERISWHFGHLDNS